MTLDRDAYKALEAVVGPRYVTEDPGLMTGYQYGILSPFSRWAPVSPQAVVLPENTAQVQGIVKVCNRYGLKFKAHSTGYGMFGMVGVENAISVDLRRMNKIIDIDEKNMVAVIEPYAVAGQIQAEAMKRGLDCQIVSAGPVHSPLASCTSFLGIGPKGLSQSWNERNLLGVEWVLPTGEVARLGSPGTGAGWFTGDGPGPSLRGVMRGANGTMGGSGIFTKIGFKLYGWPGGEKAEPTGMQPQIGMKMPENMAFYMPKWDNWEEMTDAGYKIIDNNVAFLLLRMPPEPLNWFFTKSNDDFHEAYKNGTLLFNRKDHLYTWQCVIAGYTKSEFEFKNKVFEQIVQDTGGKYIELTEEQKELLMSANIRIPYVPRIFRPTGDHATSFGLEESLNLMGKLHRVGEGVFGKYVDEKKFPNHGSESFWAWPNEGRFLHSENAFMTMVNSPESGAAAMQLLVDITKATNKEALGPHIFTYGTPLVEIIGPSHLNAHEWMRKVKNEVVDPDNVSDHSASISPKPMPLKIPE